VRDRASDFKHPVCIAGFIGLALFCGLTSSKAEGPGKALASTHDHHYSLSNRIIAANWEVTGDHIVRVAIEDKLHGTITRFPSPFEVLLGDRSAGNTSNLRVNGPVERKSLVAAPHASRYSDRVAGEEFEVPLVNTDNSLHFTWDVVLRDGSNYVREVLTLRAGDRDVPISRVELLDANLPDAHVVGSVAGSPIVAGNLFLGFEHPLSKSFVTNHQATAYMDRVLPLRAGQSITYSLVVGVAHTGQMRRDFLAYLEYERAHPYRTFLHYNSWYDLGRLNLYDEAGALDRINTFGRELHQKRGVILDSYLFDDGWDNHASLWGFNSGFPNGFTDIREAAEKYGADPGVWMSPWGGYDRPKKDRLEYGRQQGFEIVDNGFALSGAKYYAQFREVCMEMIHKYGVNQFKFDGTGNANTVFKGSAFDSDLDAAIHLISEIRQEKPGVYINLTSGTYPSPFWLQYADSTWRGGEDNGVAGIGPYRERWITYRDAETYTEIVKKGRLYPLNSLMLHGLIYAQRENQLSTDPDHNFRNEIRSYFGTGTQLQEMYITPSLLTEQNWDDLAEAAKWSRSNASVLKDTHWVGGNPASLEVYGWASWTPKKAILTLRNPSDKPQAIRLDPQIVFELPPQAAREFTARSPWKEDAGKSPVKLRAGVAREFRLGPFEVQTLDLTAQ
jgi:hypothetical protein